MSNKKKKFNSFYPCSEFAVVHYPPVQVLEEDGFIGTLVDEKPLSGNYEDYSIKNLIDSGISLKQAPKFDNSIEDVESALNQLSNFKNSQLNENEN